MTGSESAPRIAFTSLDKVFWPRTATTKKDLLSYYQAVAPVIVPQLRGHPVTLGRFPDGIDGPGWFQTTCHNHPPWMSTFTPPRSSSRYCVIDDVDGLLWAANRGAVEFHPLLGTIGSWSETGTVIFDLDPGDEATTLDCARVALLLREHLEASGLHALVKTSGWRGVHVHVRLAEPVGVDRAKQTARDVARSLSARHPGLISDRSERSSRVSRVYIDWAQNNPIRSTVAAYSLRAMPEPTAATPVTWQEVEHAVQTQDEGMLVFTPSDVRARIDRLGDLFAPLSAR